MDECEPELVMKRVSHKKNRPLPFALRAVSLWLACVQAVLPASNELFAATAGPALPALTPRIGETEPAPPRPAAAVRPVRSAPKSYPVFSSQPTDFEFFRAPAFSRPLVPVPAQQKNPAEDQEFAQAILEFFRMGNPDETAVLEQFLARHA